MDCLHSSASKPSAYWDRTDKIVRDWSTGLALPDYEGRCMVYSDLRGPIVMHTFLSRGERQWQEAGEEQFAGRINQS